MLPNLREHIIQKRPEQSTAIAKGFRRFKVKGRTYPGLVQDSSSKVSGVIIYPLEDEDYVRLDEYEGLEYYRCEIEVLNEGSGELEKVQVYLYNEVYSKNITDQNAFAQRKF